MCAIKVLSESEDPSIKLETSHLVAYLINNTGLELAKGPDSFGNRFSHHLGYHGLRSLWRKDEKRNIVSPLFSILNFQSVSIEGLTIDPPDPRAHFGIPRGWPMDLEKIDENHARLHIPPMRQSGTEYSLEVWTAEPASIEFEISLTFHLKSLHRADVHCSWACYMSAWDKLQLHYPVLNAEEEISWKAIGQPALEVLGEPVNYSPVRVVEYTDNWATGVAYGLMRDYQLIFDFNDHVRLKMFIVPEGGHLYFSPVQNPAWDFKLDLEDYERGRTYKWRGRLTYCPRLSDEMVLASHREWLNRL